jgi:large subunit ribosomal protein L29
MSHPLADEARTLSDHDLADAINESYRQLFNLQFQQGTRQLQDPTALGRARRQIARLRTVQRERAIATAAGLPLEPIAELASAPVSPQKQRVIDERLAQAAVSDLNDDPGDETASNKEISNSDNEDEPVVTDGEKRE